jgi:putative hydrolase
LEKKNITMAVDTHTHTILSGHAFSTLAENVAAAKERGLYGICVTEHGPLTPNGPPDFIPHSQRMLPDFIDGIRVYLGIEANIIDYGGRVDVPERYLALCEFAIASFHDFALKPGTKEENTAAYLGALRNPFIDILGHADDPAVPCDFEALAKEAARLGKLLELNNNSLTPHRPNSKPSLIEYIKACAKYGVGVCVASDAHFCAMIGNAKPLFQLLVEMKFPLELVVNLTRERFETYLQQRQLRLKKENLIAN